MCRSIPSTCPSTRRSSAAGRRWRRRSRRGCGERPSSTSPRRATSITARLAATSARAASRSRWRTHGSVTAPVRSVGRRSSEFLSGQATMTSRAEVLERFDRLNVWKRGGQRAPHKPLLVLYALGQWQRGDRADLPFREVDRDLTDLLKEFGPPRQAHHPEYPFWRLQRD